MFRAFPAEKEYMHWLYIANIVMLGLWCIVAIVLVGSLAYAAVKSKTT